MVSTSAFEPLIHKGLFFTKKKNPELNTSSSIKVVVVGQSLTEYKT
jgi:hypothetical protein